MKRSLLPLIALLLAVCTLSGMAALILRDMGEPIDTPELTTGDSDSESLSFDLPDSTESDTTVESTTELPPPPPLEPGELSSLQVFVYDMSAGCFLYEKGTDQPILPASITKLLTALCALHYMPADAHITPGDEQELLPKGSSVAYVKSNHTLTLSMLVEGMMLPSGNDAALAVAAGVARYVTGDPSLPGQEAVDYFMGLANDYAKTLGCTGTHFLVPDGLIYEGHYTTAHDLVLIGQAALQNEIIAGYAATVSEKVRYVSGHTMTWKNTNLLIQPESDFYSPYVTGLKTGSLTDAYSVMVSATVGESTYLMGFFGSPTKEGRFQDAHVILNLLLAEGDA